MLADLTHEEKVILYVMGVLEELKHKGLIEGRGPLTDEGLKTIAELKASGFEPTDKEVKDAMDVLLRRGYVG